MEHDSIDLSLLRLSANPMRRARLIDSIVRRAIAARRHQLSFAFLVWSWARPALALATAAAMVTLIATSLSGARIKDSAVAKEDPTMTLVAWATTNEMPSTATILEVLGGSHGSR